MNKLTDISENYYTLKEVHQELGTAIPKTLSDMCRRGRIPGAMQIEGKGMWYVPKEWVKETKENPLVVGRPHLTKVSRFSDKDNPLYRFRLKHNLSQKEIAPGIGVSPATLNRYENNVSIPKKDTLKVINAFLLSYGEPPLAIVDSKLVEAE